MIDKIEKGFTHGGVFHADDVFSTAFLKILFPEINIERGFEVPKNYDGIVYDIGGGDFDHHMVGAPVRKNGVPYAAFGLLWNYFGKSMFNEDIVSRFDREFVQILDETDNTGKKNPLSQVIKDFNPGYGEENDYNKCFWKAVEFAKQILERKLELLKLDEKIKNTLKPLVEACDKRYLVIEEDIPLIDYVFDGSTIDYAVTVSERGGYVVRVIGKREQNYFPEEWRGLSGEALVNVTGIEGMTFCHKTGFIVATASLEAAIQVAERVTKLI